MIQDSGAVLLSFVIEMQVMADKSHAGVLSLDLLIFWGMTWGKWLLQVIQRNWKLISPQQLTDAKSWL